MSEIIKRCTPQCGCKTPSDVRECVKHAKLEKLHYKMRRDDKTVQHILITDPRGIV